ncbi:DUF6605 domain-containing protein [Mesorhizobium sp. BAC0120]|uniref:N,N-dimethylformamidase beta subunit family domain-containing protein n=1 Tax=Mesorhizobium sp. BAC0120 TaxID=3090670 RepID=UPI00298CC8F0|nr:N,N-dimethylformamidase beta subunit family domain-containing protein [Mesorhizobium sp. BAC0120]MDW6021425.1 DUF6605 domain-containing protein [Mesorhizobium sp. BAC0120]
MSMRITGYTERWAFRPGEAVPVRVSSEYPRYVARLIRHIGPISRMADWERNTETIDDVSIPAQRGTVRSISIGSHASASFDPPLEAGGLSMRVELGLAADMTLARLRFESGELVLGCDASGLLLVNAVATTCSLQIRRWAQVHLMISGAQAEVCVRSEFDRTVAGSSVALNAEGRLTELLLAPRFEGRLAAPTILDVRGDVVASWTFGEANSSLALHNAPTLSLRSCGRNADAAGFHFDDLGDATWPADFTLALPPDIRSGAYGILLSETETVDWADRGSFDVLPIFVAPKSPEARVAMVLPTFSYRAYGNSTFFEAADPEVFKLKAKSWSAPLHRYAEQHGLKSLYDTHPCGEGVCLATLKRPHMTTRADYVSLLQGFAHQYSADLMIVGWLEKAGYAYDLLTDEVLHAQGASALAGYDAVLTGSHPEYASPQTLDAYESYAASGGSMLYLGGNGFYWSIGVDPNDPAIIEVRRRHGVRTWTARAGETRHQTDGAEGGLWRDLDRAPNRLTGVGFAAHGYSGDGAYRIPDGIDLTALPPRLANTLSMIGRAEFGIAGLELDAHNQALGEPGPVTVLASAVSMPRGYVPAIEEFGALDAFLPDANAALARAIRGDLVLADLPGGGKVFSVGSIRWTSGLADPADVNWVRRITTAALDDLLALAADRRASHA